MGNPVTDSAGGLLANMPVEPGVYTTQDGSLTLQIDQKGRIVSARAVSSSSPSATVVDANAISIQGIPVSPATPKSGQVLVYQSGQWNPRSPSVALRALLFVGPHLLQANGGRAMTRY